MKKDKLNRRVLKKLSKETLKRLSNVSGGRKEPICGCTIFTGSVTKNPTDPQPDPQN